MQVGLVSSALVDIVAGTEFTAGPVTVAEFMRRRRLVHITCMVACAVLHQFHTNRRRGEGRRGRQGINHAEMQLGL
jgi:hypothetical protein